MHTSSTVSISEKIVPRIILTTGEPAGIGPDLVVAISRFSFDAELVCIADPKLLKHRAELLSQPLELIEYTTGNTPVIHQPGSFLYRKNSLQNDVVPGRPDSGNVRYVLESIDLATDACLSGTADAMVTLPVNKAVINDAGYSFTGHTEYIAQLCKVSLPVMMLMNDTLRIALVTTHLPLSQVSSEITSERLEETLQAILRDVPAKLGISNPAILVCGLNPHAGESGHLGTEELDIIIPVIEKFKSSGVNISGPVPADTAFTGFSLEGIDIVVAMYHDQGLPVLKSQGFGDIVNVTLGLPIIRVSVDHGTALDLAGTGKASPDSLKTSIETAIHMVWKSALKK